MALTPTTMLPLGTPLPQALLERERNRVSCHCTFVKHIEAEITRLQKDLGDRAVLLGIASNSLRTHPQDGPDRMAAQAATHGWTFPYLLDRDQSVARAFQAASTPDPFLFDRAHRLAYRGQLDPSRPGNDLPCDGRDLRAALAAVLADQPVSESQIASIGCNIKWHPGAAPAWAR